MKVKIQQRSVYHKFAEVEIEVPDHIKEDMLVDWIYRNEHLYTDNMDNAIGKAEYEFGFGTDCDSNQYNKSCMDETHSESEWRYECDKLKLGGHL